jgi:hypothetical protein
MGWPKKDADEKLYFERKAKTYLMVFFDRETRRNEGIGEMLIDSDLESPMLGDCAPSPIYLYKKCRRVSWSDMPKVWQDAFRVCLNVEPEECRGFWRMKELKEMENVKQNRAQRSLSL